MLMKKILQKFFLVKKSRQVEDRLLSKYASDQITVLDIGAKDKGNSIYFPKLTTLNTEKSDGVDIVADAEDLRGIIGDDKFDMVLCLSVFEHTKSPSKLIEEIKRILKPGGQVIVLAPFIMCLHDTPGDYWRFTQYGIELLFKDGFEKEYLAGNMDSLQTMGYMYHRLFLQTKVFGLRFFALIFFLISKINYLFHGIITEEYGYVNFSKKEKDILSNIIIGVFRKK